MGNFCDEMIRLSPKIKNKKKNKPLTIKALCKEAHKMAVEKGFWSEAFTGYKIERNNGELLMLITSELGECLEGLRHGNPKSEHIPKFSAAEEELSDAIIRIADMAEANNYRLEEAIKAKMKFNKTRKYKHGKEF